MKRVEEKDGRGGKGREDYCKSPCSRRMHSYRSFSYMACSNSLLSVLQERQSLFTSAPDSREGSTGDVRVFESQGVAVGLGHLQVALHGKVGLCARQSHVGVHLLEFLVEGLKDAEGSVSLARGTSSIVGRTSYKAAFSFLASSNSDFCASSRR